MLLEHCQVIVDQLSLSVALRRVSEGIECRAAKEFEPREQAKWVNHPAAIFLLLQMACNFVAARKERGGEVGTQGEVAVGFPPPPPPLPPPPKVNSKNQTT